MLNRLKIVGMMAVLTFVAFGCLEESDFEKQQNANEEAIKKYLNDNGIEAEQSTYGIYYEMLTENEEGIKPESGDVVYASYEIKTLNGSTVLESVSEPVAFKFNWNSILPNGISYGLDILKTGEKIRFYLPAHVAYDSYSPDDGSFGPHTNFIVEMELHDTTDEEAVYVSEIDSIEAYIETNAITDIVPSSSGLYFKTLEAGEGDEPELYNYVTLHFTRKYLDGTVIAETEADSPLEVRLNENALVEGFHEGVMKMKEGEKALLIMPSKLAFGGSIQVIPEALRQELFEQGYITTNVKPYSPVIYEVELIEIN